MSLKHKEIFWLFSENCFQSDCMCIRNYINFSILVQWLKGKDDKRVKFIHHVYDDDDDDDADIVSSIPI